MRTKRILFIASLGALAACAGESTPPTPTGIGALLVSADIADETIDRAVYAVTGDGIDVPLTGTLAFADGTAEGQLQVPAGAGRAVTLQLLSRGQVVCQA